MGKRIQGISSAAMEVLLGYSWPGNVRELENVIERGVLLSEDAFLMPEHLPPGLGARDRRASQGDTVEGFSIKAAQRVMEKKLIIHALQETGGNRTQAARLLEISHPSLLSKIKAYEIEL
jgi:two-component system response regulator AtoC